MCVKLWLWSCNANWHCCVEDACLISCVDAFSNSRHPAAGRRPTDTYVNVGALQGRAALARHVTSLTETNNEQASYV